MHRRLIIQSTIGDARQLRVTWPVSVKSPSCYPPPCTLPAPFHFLPLSAPQSHSQRPRNVQENFSCHSAMIVRLLAVTDVDYSQGRRYCIIATIVRAGPRQSPTSTPLLSQPSIKIAYVGCVNHLRTSFIQVVQSISNVSGFRTSSMKNECFNAEYLNRIDLKVAYHQTNSSVANHSSKFSKSFHQNLLPIDTKLTKFRMINRVISHRR